MPKNIKKLNKFLLVVAIFSFSLFYIVSKQKALALTLSPPRLEINGDPGQTLVGELEIYNEQDQQITFYISTQNFEARGETGSPYFLPYDGTGLASWIFSNDSVLIGPKERANVQYQIVIPQDAEAGGYFASIFFATSPQDPQEAGQVTIGSKVGTLVFLNISGDAPEGAGVIEFKSKGNVYSYLPVDLYYRFSNDGARKLMPLGTVEIKSMLGKTAANLDANRSMGNVLPGSVRRFEMTWASLGQDDISSKDMAETQKANTSKVGFFDAVKMQKENFAFGRYTANLNLKYGDNKTATNQAIFWVIPWQMLTLIAGAILIIVIITKLLMKRHNKKLVEQVKKENLSAQQVTIAPTEKVEENEEVIAEAEEPKEEPTSEDKPEEITPEE